MITVVELVINGNKLNPLTVTVIVMEKKLVAGITLHASLTMSQY